MQAYVRIPAVVRTLEKCERSPSGCLLFGGCRTAAGYGQIKDGGRVRYTHRVVYEALVGAIPDGHHLDHLCQTPACCEVAHLEPVLPTVNRARVSERQTHCVHGHLYTEANTYRRPDRGTRMCRTCQRER